MNGLGHTAAWKVSMLPHAAYRALKAFTGSSAALEGTIARHQIEMAVRAASEKTGRALRVVRRDIVDASGAGRDADLPVLPVVGSIAKDFRLEQGLFTGHHTEAFAAVAEAYAGARQTIHSTVVAEIVKRYVRRALAGFPLRDHGGVYFVPRKREEGLFDLEGFLQREGVGRITRIRVMGDAHETRMLTEEIERLVQSRLEELKSRLAETDLSDPKEAAKARKRFLVLRNDLAEMRELFGFARQEIQRQDARARRTLAEAVRRASAASSSSAARGEEATLGTGWSSRPARFGTLGEAAPAGAAATGFLF